MRMLHNTYSTVRHEAGRRGGGGNNTFKHVKCAPKKMFSFRKRGVSTASYGVIFPPPLPLSLDIGYGSMHGRCLGVIVADATLSLLMAGIMAW